ncbi:MAG: hypothetical protein ABJA37_00530 [Ferruginibacter sp.]
MKVIQSQLTNYSYANLVQKNIKLVRWWLFTTEDLGIETARPFTEKEEDIFIKYLDDHPANFPNEKTEVFDSNSFLPPDIGLTDRDTDTEKPCLLIIRKDPGDTPSQLCRRMDIVLQNDLLPIQLPFDVAGEIIMEKV